MARTKRTFKFWEFANDDPSTISSNVDNWLAKLSKTNKKNFSESNWMTESAEDYAAILESAQNLVRATASSDAYVSQVMENGGLNIFLKLLNCADEKLIDFSSAILANCSGPMASRSTTKLFKFNGGINIEVKEMTFDEGGLGWKVWGTAVMLAKRITVEPSVVKQKKVLELGSGCGLCGLLSAKLGAKEITLTDCVPKILQNIRENVSCLPANPMSFGVISRRHSDSDSKSTQEIDANDFLFPNYEHLGEAECKVRVRYLEWAMDSGKEIKIGELSNFLEKYDAIANVPLLNDEERFDTIIASDVIYQSQDIESIVGVIKKRLAFPNGECHFTHTVRKKKVLEEWIQTMQLEKLDVKVTSITPQEPYADLITNQNKLDSDFINQDELENKTATTHGLEYYEDGFVSIIVRHT